MNSRKYREEREIGPSFDSSIVPQSICRRVLLVLSNFGVNAVRTHAVATKTTKAEDKQTETQTERHTQRETHRKTKIERDTETDREIDR